MINNQDLIVSKHLTVRKLENHHPFIPKSSSGISKDLRIFAFKQRRKGLKEPISLFGVNFDLTSYTLIFRA